MAEPANLCPFCGAYGPRQCDLREEAGCCPWEEAEEAGANLGDDAGTFADELQEEEDANG